MNKQSLDERETSDTMLIKTKYRIDIFDRWTRILSSDFQFQGLSHLRQWTVIIGPGNE